MSPDMATVYCELSPVILSYRLLPSTLITYPRVGLFDLHALLHLQLDRIPASPELAGGDRDVINFAAVRTDTEQAAAVQIARKMRSGGGKTPRPAPVWKSSTVPDQEKEAAATVAGSFGARGGWAAARKKGAGPRAWLAVDAAGEVRVVEAGKHAIMQRTGLPGRDLRILDPQLSCPSTVLGRERAIVVNLEHIKAIVTAQEVLLLNYRDEAVAPFVQELQRRLIRRHHGGDQDDGNGSSADWTNAYDLEEPTSRTHTPQNDTEDADEKGKREPVSSHRPRDISFEFVALEACLEAACSCLENEAATLEKEAHPALDKLTSKISSLNLEHVRQIKSRLVAISGRVQKVRDELEHLLDDDDDMAEMYLTEKLTRQEDTSDGSSHSSLYAHGDGMDEDRTCAEFLSEEIDNESNQEGETHNISHHYRMHVINGDSHGTRTYSTRSSSKHLHVQELEMLLEAYFIQIDGTLNNLSTLREYVDDTEDYINIMLDDKQNHLLQMGVMLTTATLIVSAFVAIVGVFGMNIQVDLFDEKKSGMTEFLWTIGGGSIGSVLLYVIAIAWCKHRRLLE
ncbi:magnesium transporter MRS2-3 isoform X1 [Canna indica]|uniref:Magnesium transporter n=1 Tax=Canna indica TaxID=4628 RepID=A0AAQ3K1X0_9LILI|nr:magnesium transporter MRS2-3 isoform X1 [Canna indica]